MLILTPTANAVLGAADRRKCQILSNYNSLLKHVLLVHGELLAKDKLMLWPPICRPPYVRPSVVPRSLLAFHISTSPPKP